jgi:NADPH2:quinone reductase
MPTRAKDEAARDILRLVEAGRLIHQIGARFPLDRVVEAHQAQESGKITGNIVIDISAD